MKKNCLATKRDLAMMIDVNHLSSHTMITKTAAANFFKSIEEFKQSTPANRIAADKKLDKAIAAYRKVYNLSDAMGLIDLINHFNANNSL